MQQPSAAAFYESAAAYRVAKADATIRECRLRIDALRRRGVVVPSTLQCRLNRALQLRETTTDAHRPRGAGGQVGSDARHRVKVAALPAMHLTNSPATAVRSDDGF